ncbi:MAG: cytidine deaminase [Sediminibacterium sp.]
MQKKFEFEYEELDTKEGLTIEDLTLLTAAYDAVETAFAPYSKFKVGAAARLSNGQIILGSNQESASYPVGICAERTLLNSIGSQYPNETITAMAISYIPHGAESDHPLSPCGMCRQSLLDYELRYKAPIKLILAGKTGKIMLIPSANNILPFGFTGSILGK